MRFRTKLLPAVLAIVVTLTVIASGCGSPSSEPSGQTTGSTAPGKTLTAQEIASKSVSAYATLTAVKMGMDMTMALETTGGEQPLKINMVADGAGSIDMANTAMQLTMNVDMEMPVLGKQKVLSDMYMVGGWIYQRLGVPGLGDQWMKMKLDEAMWQQQNQLSQQIEFLKTAVEVTLLGTETVNGVEAYVLRIKPDAAALAGWVKGQVPQQSGADVLDKVDPEAMFKAFSVKQWIATKDFMVVKADIEIAIEMNATDVGAEAGDMEQMTMDMAAVVKYFDHNEPVTVTLPPEAATAKELPNSR